MAVMTTLPSPTPLSTHAVGASVWQRVWQHVPSDEKDDANLRREMRNPRWTAIVHQLEATFGSIEGLRTVELGCGRADLSVLLARRGADVTLLDYSTQALELARRRFDRLGLTASYAQANMLDGLANQREAYDVSLSIGVIEHFKGFERTRTLRAHHDVLRPGGMTLISVPNSWCGPYRAWKAYLELRGRWPYGMEIPYTRRELLERSRRAGFNRLCVEGMGLWQAISDQWGRSVFGVGPDWVEKTSRMDSAIGATLLMFGWRPNRPRI